MNDSSRAYIITSTGRKFNLLDLDIDNLDVKDRAHALSLQCRWTGHCRFHYSVAQHGFYCSYLGPESEALWRLTHDDSEAYIGDMNRPLKHYTNAGIEYRKVESPLQDMIYRSIGLYGSEPTSVKLADEGMLYAEMQQLLPPISWALSNPYGFSKAAPVIIEKWEPEFAEFMYLRRYHELKGKQ